jgi:hypothetical protein
METVEVENIEVEEPQLEAQEEPEPFEEEAEITEEERQPAQLDIHLDIGRLPPSFSEALKVLDAVGVEEVTLQFKGGNLEICQMDASRVCLVRASYEMGLVAAQETAFAVNVKELLRILKSFENPHFRVEGNRLIAEDKNMVQGDGRVKEVTPKRYETLILEPDNIDVPIEHLEKLKFSVKAKVDFAKLWRYAKVFGSDKNLPDALKFEANNIVLSATLRGDFNNLSVQIAKAEGEGKATYATAYLSALSGEWTVEYATDMPLKAHHSLNGITVYLAPRIETD